MNEHAADGWAE